MSSIHDHGLLTKLVCVRDFARPIWGEVDVDEAVGDKLDGLMDYCDEHELDMDDCILLVAKAGSVPGYILHEPAGNQTAKDLMLPITPSIIVRYEYLLGLPLRMIVFSLLLALETKMLSILQQNPSVSVSFLSAGRLHKAEMMCAYRGVKPQEDGSYLANAVLDLTTFIDRCETMLRFGEVSSQLPFPNRNKARGFFKHLENIRNDIAHCRDPKEVDANPQLLKDVLTGLLDCITAL
jgi:hypothetical protein